MALDRYNAKRDFARTKEPRGEAGADGGRAYLIQKHDARRLHYDLRLELDGVLLSWAVTRGPSLVPGEKRLAVHVEDHPLAYGDFEGTIPKGEYGGGTVLLWDRGSWAPIGDAKKGLKKGHLEFTLDGEKLTGRWHLVRLRGKPGEKRENWLLIKSEDAAARAPEAPDILEERPESVKTGRQIPDIAGEAPGWSSKTGAIASARDKTAGTKKTAADSAGRSAGRSARAKTAGSPSPRKPRGESTMQKGGTPPPTALEGARPGPLPDFLPPLLATRVMAAPAGEAWIHEIKFDGYRIQARISGGKVRLLTRGGLDWTARFGAAIVDALRALPADAALMDGELVVEGAGGASDFSALQADLSASRKDRFILYLFDLMHLDGADLTGCPLIVRKAALAALLDGAGDPLRVSAHFEEDGALVLRHACRLSLEGVVSKKRDSRYVPGRGRTWVKSRCAERQELVIAGYVPSTTGRDAIGSLVLGYYGPDGLVHAGRVGTGFSQATAGALMRELKPLKRKTSPFAARLPAEAARGAVFVAPDRVAEVEFRGWTADGSLRHAAFRGLRDDKDPREVVRESGGDAMAQAPRSKVRLTHPDRLYWPDAGVTKAGLADYYAEVWRAIAPFVVNRPLALVRCPEGIAGQCFFQKHVWRGAAKAIRLMPDPKAPDDQPLVSVADLDGLIGLVQAGVLEIHPWGATFDALEQPDQMIFDLDPGEGVAWPEVIAAALEVRARLAARGLESFVKTSGGKGLHVVAPLVPKADWTVVKPFTKALADEMAKDAPDRFVATVAKAKRTGRILIDYLRNGRGSTAVAPYSTRARPGAPVSMPLAWEDLSPEIGPAHFTVLNTVARLAALERDPWADFRAAAKPLPVPASRRRKRD
ncbi:DNA ligase D [Aquabacter spiritensis]|uniref:DNA ligase (ATP) n=1 Tax=Aquabacter spiritensis TaxID=933073 RepID=A0A4R3M1W7_9HYPH|nr:DNA ligase D [Aquabacter spiritensis]TCT06676.1 ATP-dependent DNA ligase LigD phosphoesterase module /ATP-dependent DNA ligase LigD polymerase module [Aquabacter spiritensis]